MGLSRARIGALLRGPFVVLLLVAQCGRAESNLKRLSTIYDFEGPPDGAGPFSGLVAGTSGSLYGTTQFGGSSTCAGGQYPGCGTVYELVPPTGSGTAWMESVLYSFEGGIDGQWPYGGLVQDQAGNLYGTTEAQGGGYGTVFRLAPPSTSGGGWAKTTLYSFTSQNGDGADPRGNLALGLTGEIYGTTISGGSYGGGTVFVLQPPTSGNTWTESVLHSFGGVPDGEIPWAGVAIGKNGSLYGTTVYGGNGICGTTGLGCGIVFELAPPTIAGGPWTESVLYSFTGRNGDGACPYATPAIGRSGDLFGTASGGGSLTGTLGEGLGTVFELARPSRPHGPWVESILHRFAGGQDGGTPYAGLTVTKNESLYGTTTRLTVFKIRKASAGQSWTETVLQRLTGSHHDGLYPYGGVIFGPDGGLYGTTIGGGMDDHGTVFEVAP